MIINYCELWILIAFECSMRSAFFIWSCTSIRRNEVCTTDDHTHFGFSLRFLYSQLTKHHDYCFSCHYLWLQFCFVTLIVALGNLKTESFRMTWASLWSIQQFVLFWMFLGDTRSHSKLESNRGIWVTKGLWGILAIWVNRGKCITNLSYWYSVSRRFSVVVSLTHESHSECPHCDESLHKLPP